MKMYDLTIEINPEDEVTIAQYTNGDVVSIFITKDMLPAVIKSLTTCMVELGG